jgi:lipid-binding SYLF domain-containing protein
MSGRTLILIATLSCLALCAAQPLVAQRAEVRKVEIAREVFQAIVSVPEHEVPVILMKKAVAVAIIPGVQRVGFVIGMQRGNGVLLARAADGSWSRPVFVTLTGGSVGWQAGVQSADIVLFFMTRDSADRVLKGNYTIGVGASVSAGSFGRQAGAATDQDLEAEIYSYSRTRGIFAGLAVEGAALDVDYDANARYYGKEIAQGEDVLSGKGLPDPASAVALRKVIAAYEKGLQ